MAKKTVSTGSMLFGHLRSVRKAKRVGLRRAFSVSLGHSAVLAGRREDDGTIWQQLAYAGEWYGHPDGDFEFDRALFEEIVANFERRKDDLAVVHGHPRRDERVEADYRGAAGWISELRIDKDGEGRDALFARIKWTKRTAQKIRDDEYRYCSVVVLFNSTDEATGEEIGAELIELGVVTMAFLDGMHPLAAGR